MGFNSGFKVLIYWHINKHNAMSHFKKLNWIEITLANNAYKIYLLIYRVLIRVAAITVYFFFFCEILCYHSIVAEDSKCVVMLRRFDW